MDAADAIPDPVELVGDHLRPLGLVVQLVPQARVDLPRHAWLAIEGCTGADDSIVPTDASAALDGKPGVTRKVYPGLRHELHNEPEGPQVIADELQWIRDRVSRIHTPSAA